LGEGLDRETTQAARAAIQQGRVIVGMSEDEVILAMGEEPTSKESTSDGKYTWLYQRSSGILTINFGRNGRVESYTTPAENKKKAASKKTQARRKAATNPKANNDWERQNGTPL
jgi:outer membrane protein assembly factor BamE (lipoprotein component of BamABCDE complex)